VCVLQPEQQKTFVEIAIPEIAEQAKCSAATIYGRFQDKNSILVALHEALREKMICAVDDALRPQRWAGRSVLELSQAYATETLMFYKKNRNLLVAALAIGDSEIYERAAATIRHVATRFSQTIRALENCDVGVEFEARIDTGIKIFFALLQQRIVFHPTLLNRTGPNTEAAFIAELVAALMMFAKHG
jgi:AcrR family transcriptional regulator